MSTKKRAALVLWLVLLHSVAGAQKIMQKGFIISENNITTEVRFVQNNIVRVYKAPGRRAFLKESLVVEKGLQPTEKITVQSNGGNISASSKSLKVVWNKAVGKLQFFSLEKGLVAEELGSGATFSKTDNDGKLAYMVTQGFGFGKNEGIYGFGQHQNGHFNQRNDSLLLRQRNMSIGIPFFQSAKGYGIYWDNYALTRYTPLANGATIASEVGDCIDYYFIWGGNADNVIKGYRKLTGEVPMLPLWSFGYLQSKERYRSQKELVEVVKKYRQLQVPLDGVIQDWQYWGSDMKNWNAVDFLNLEFPNPQKAFDSIHAMNAKVVISVWPSFGSKSQIFKELDKNKLLLNFYTYPVSDSVKVYDAFNPLGRKIYWDYLNKNLFAKGVDGWWLDATEPVQKEVAKSVNVSNEHEVSFKDMLASVDNVATYLGSFKSVANLYPFESVRSVYDGQRSLTADKRAFILTRSAFAGQQRTGAVLWSGDVTASWEVLKAQVPAALSTTMSGMPYWNSDIGGFFSVRKYPAGFKSILYKELYLRWLQFSVFTAMMRSHGTNIAREIYQLGNPGDLAYDVAKKYIQLRYQLQPYIYSAAWEISKNSGSLMRPLLMDFPDDKNSIENKSAYLFGKTLLVAPVTDSIFTQQDVELNDQRAVDVKTYLPKGKWYDFFSDNPVSGGSYITQQLKLSQFPVFVKAGSVLPLAKVSQYSDIRNFAALDLRIYPGENGSFNLYEDEGDGYNYEKGNYSLIPFVWNEKAKTLTIGNRKGSFKGMVPVRTFTVKLVSTTKTKKIPYNGRQQVIKF